MADESLIEFLHAEIVKYVIDSNDDKVNTKCSLQKYISTLEYLGYITGFRIIERLTREWSPFKNELETMKFLCTDFWSSIYMKQIDNLRTNHKGVYVLQDNAFRYLVHLSSQKQYLEFAPRFVAFTCGLIRGALSNLGITCLVTAEVDQMPACKFHIQVQRS
ncbi:trafficking protein particle complex subunit 6B, putative [Pediculus humanus corporis]|uniref:Trafficking protein particle complex subunit 6B n=1 Tax=Pediculus humanus subsp. corporis TaxID=121224 RepID=E0V955_PEDHC|nr:trafficking protein particle complex subunit 6B, putative [Pediculus humanus corporis]EEB09911.1 trafficking protein particle complex subunit 6B, putative [Pediculus humanus corporis]